MNRYILFLPVFFIPYMVRAEAFTPDSLKAEKLTSLAVEKAASSPDSSLVYLRQALKIYNENNNLISWIEACKKLGVELDMAGNLEAAMKVYEHATLQQLFRQPVSREEWEALGWLYTNAGYTLFWYGKFYQAKPWYEEARRIFEDKAETADRKVAQYVFRELGNLYTRFGDFEAALLLLEQVKKIALADGDFNLAAEASNDIGIVYFDQGENLKALDICRQALSFPGLTQVSKGLLESTLAHILHEKGENKSAYTHALHAIGAFEHVLKRELHPSAKIWLAQAHQLAGELTPAPDAARKHFHTSLALMKNYFPDTLRREFAKLRLSMAQYYSAQNQLEASLAEQQTALRSVLYRFDNTDPMANPAAGEFYPENVIMEALGSKAETFRSLYKRQKNQVFLQKALECHELAFEAERAYRQVHHFESSKLVTVAESSRRTESALEAAWQFYRDFNDRHALEQAFSFTEKSKSTLLYEALRHTGASAIANIPAQMLEQEKQLKDELAEKEKSRYLLSGKAQKADVEALEREIFNLRSELAGLHRQLEKSYPAFYEMKYNQETVSVAEAQALLRNDQALVEYFVGDSTLFIFLIKKDKFHLERIPKDFPLEKWVSGFREGIEAFQFSGSDRDSLCREYSRLGQLLYQKLLLPLEKYQLPEALVIIPGGILGFLPFDALLYESPPAMCVFKKYPYVMRRHNISYNYSATLFKELSEHQPPSRVRFAGLAPAFPENNGSGFGPLRFSMASVKEISASWNGISWTGREATRENFFNQATGHNLIYLATHAKANTNEGDFSFVVLAGQGGGYDTLFVKDIYNLPLTADLVFLGACETGSGKWHSGEGIISLARSFLYAGAKSIITTLWSINDESNRNLTAGFFKHLYSGQRKDEAMWNAKREQLESEIPDLYAHPVYWAAYTPIGNMEPVRKKAAWWYFLAVPGLIGLVAFYLKKKTASQKHAAA